MDRRSALHASARRQRAASRSVRETDQAEGDLADAMIPEQMGPTIEPLLTGPAPGGPHIPDLLLGFEGHVAHHIWAGDERETLKLHIRTTQLSRWILDEDHIWSELVSSSGLAHLQTSMYSRHNGKLISAFVERWHPETNSFHMPFGEMSITLHDVYYLLGICIAGDVVSHNMDSKAVLKELVGELQITEKELIQNQVGRRGFPYEFLVEHCEGENVDILHPESIATSFLLYLLCSTLFTDKTQNRLSLAYLPLLRNHSQVNCYSWGSATLAYLYHRLGEASRRDCSQMCGCITLLEAWIYSYFPKFRPTTSSNWNKETEPFACKWKDVTMPAPYPNYRKILDGMQQNEVDWMPYGHLDFYHPAIAPSRFHGIISCLDINEPYMPDRFARQFGRQQRIPSNVIKPKIAKRGVNNADYKVVYETGEWAWNLVHIHSMAMDMIGDQSRYPGDVSDEYASWYEPRTHRFVHPSSAPTSEESMHMQRALGHLTPWFAEDRRSQVPDDVHQSMMHAAIELGYMSLNDHTRRTTFDVGQGSNPSREGWGSWNDNPPPSGGWGGWGWGDQE